MMRLRLLCAASALALASHAYAQSCGAGEHCFAQPVRLNSDYSWTGGVFHPDLDTSGTISDDARLQAAINSCAAVGGTVYLPAGDVLLTGVAGTTNIHNCKMIGAGGPLGGTEIDITSTTVPPFTFGSGWEIDDVTFYWPNQTGAIVYPPLLTAAGPSVANFNLVNDTVINGYIDLDFPAGTGVGSFLVSGGNWFATNALIEIASTIGDSAHLTSMHMTPGPWLDRCGGFTPTCEGYVDAGSVNNSVLHVLSGGNPQLYWDNSANFDWRYGILVDNGGSVTSSRFAFAWDGTGSVLDTSAVTSTTAWADQDEIESLGGSFCGFHNSYVHGDTDAYYPCFNLGADASLYLHSGHWTSRADLVDMTGGNFTASGTVLQSAPMAATSNVYVVNATGVAPQIDISDTRIEGIGGKPYILGISVSGVTGTGRYKITGDYFANIASALNIPTGSPTIIANNFSGGMDDTADVTFSNASYGVYWHGNAFEFPPAASVSACGTGATVSGALSGVITVGTTVPTTSCTLVLPFNPPGETSGSCVFSGVPTTIAAVAAAKPPQWTLTFGADVHGDTVSYNCAGNQ